MAQSHNDRADRVAFFLVPDFPLLSYACAVEALRAANALGGRTLYRWSHLTSDGKPATASNGVMVPADSRRSAGQDFDIVVVCAGGDLAEFDDAATFSWLRAMARRRCRLGGLAGGPWVLARAGVLQGFRMTLHWEYADGFAEEFPDLDLRRSLFELDRGRLTCSGGIAALDMMHELIKQDHGPDLATAVSERLLQTRIREGVEPSRMDLRSRTGITNRTVLRALAAMESATDQPLSRDELAKAAGVTPRHLERLFRALLHRTPGEHYLQLRLGRARLLLRQTDMTILEVAVACGFTSASHFARAYRREWSHAPSTEKARSRRSPT
jgi:transcriptional regulator GlxA family with amidase domain